MKKLLLVAILSMFLMASVFALNGESIRAKDGSVNFIGNDVITPTKTTFSVWKSFWIFGSEKATLQVIGTTQDNARVVLNLNIANGKATGTYWKTGVGIVKISSETVTYDYDFASKTLSVDGIGQIEFSLSDLKANQVA